MFEGESVVRFSIEADHSKAFEELNIPYIPTKTLSHALTSREAASLALVLYGFTAKQAAIILDISHRTIETHLQHAYQKLGVFSKQDCLEKFIEDTSLHIWHQHARAILARK
jgi:DNA-binding CsgD family transcriptional regulator